MNPIIITIIINFVKDAFPNNFHRDRQQKGKALYISKGSPAGVVALVLVDI